MSPDVCPSSVVQRAGNNCGTQHNLSNSLIGKSGRKGFYFKLKTKYNKIFFMNF